MGIITGALWAQGGGRGYWATDATVLFSFLTWLVYLLLIFYRMSGWRGRKAAYLSIVGFIGVLVTLVGTNYFGGLHSLQ
jgi:ABC-type transport system involved in cytochrome c biogenesis permease subunit